MHRHAQAGSEARQRLRGQADLGHQHQRLPAARETGGDGAQVDLGLAAAGDAVEQERAETAGHGQRVGRLLLFLVEDGAGTRHGFADAGRGRNPFGEIPFGQGAGRIAPAFHAAGKLVLRLRPGGQPFGELARAAARTQARQGGEAGFGQSPLPGLFGGGHRLALAQGRRQRGGEHLAQRRVRVARQPAQRVQDLAVQQRLRVQPCMGRLQFHRLFGRSGVGHPAHQLAAAEGHAHAPAHVRGRNHRVRRRAIVEQSGQRNGQGDAENCGRRHPRSLASRSSAAGWAGLRDQSVKEMTKFTQVRVSQRDSGLSTRAVDKSVHVAIAPRADEPFSGLGWCLVEKNANANFLFLNQQLNCETKLKCDGRPPSAGGS